jgi:TonB family protein
MEGDPALLFSTFPCKLIAYILPLIIIAAATTVEYQAQSIRKAASRRPPTLPTSISILEGTKDQDGLIGPVNRVRTETAKLSMKSGKLKEGPRALLEITVYDLEGKRIENRYYPVAESHNLWTNEEYKYDDKGNVTQMTLRDQNGAILSREVYEYQFDEFGNWKKMITSLMVYEEGLRYEPVEVTYRTISYYSNEAIAKAGKSDSSALAPRVVAPAEGIRNATGSQLAGLVSANGKSSDPRVPIARLISGGSESDLVIPKATYPAEAKRAGVTGTVAVEVTLDPEGHVIDARAISGPPMLRPAAEEAAFKARLSPGPHTQSKRSAVISFTFSLLR